MDLINRTWLRWDENVIVGFWQNAVKTLQNVFFPEAVNTAEDSETPLLFKTIKNNMNGNKMEKTNKQEKEIVLIIVKFSPKIFLLIITKSYAEQVYVVVKADGFIICISAGWRKA